MLQFSKSPLEESRNGPGMSGKTIVRTEMYINQKYGDHGNVDFRKFDHLPQLTQISRSSKTKETFVVSLW